MRITASTRIKLNTPQMRRLVGDAAARALKKAGMRVQEKTQREMSNRAPLKKPRFMKVAQKDGSDLVAAVYRVPRQDKVTSWKTGKNPKGFLRSDIKYEYDTRTRSVVIGPRRFPKLNQLHEFGGTTPLYFVPIPAPKTRSRKFRAPRYGHLTNKPNAAAIYTFTRNIKARRYMERGLRQAMPQIPQQFKDTVRGP